MRVSAHAPSDGRAVAGGADGAASRRGWDLSPRIGWSLVTLLTVAVLLSWTPSLTAGLGDNHEGRILSRHALHVRNAQADGLAASGWLSDWSPYVGRPEGDQTTYSHHPPLLNLGYYLTAQTLPVPRDTAMRVFAYLLGAAALPVGAAILRRLRFGWVPVLVATTTVAATPLFWVYGRLHGNVTLLLLMVLAVVRVAEPRRIGRAELAAASAASLAAVVAGYLGLATAALLGLWLLAKRRLDLVTLAVGAAMTVGAAITLAYVVGNTGSEAIGAQLEMRTQGGDFTAREFVARIGGWATALLPVWWRWVVLPVAVVAGLWDRRTRALTAVTGLVAVAYVVGLPNGSYIHDYWIFPVLLPVWLGAAAAVSRLTEVRAFRSTRDADGVDGADADSTRSGGGVDDAGGAAATAGGGLRGAVAGAAVGAVVLAAGAGGALVGNVPSRYLVVAEAAGNLARDTQPPAGQTVAWRTAGIAAPRWLSYYWDLPPALVTREDAADVPDEEYVFVRLDTAPGWLGDARALRDAALRVEGDYAVVTGATLRALADLPGD